MKQATFLSYLLCMVMASRQHHVQIPLQIPYAESVVENQVDATFALYLLSEVEDTIDNYPDSIRMRYHLAQAMAMNARGDETDSTLMPLLEWFDAKGPALECARAHHLRALILLRQGNIDPAQQELDRALKAMSSYQPSLFLSGYLFLWCNDYNRAMECFMCINDYKAGIPVQGAWALKKSLNTIEGDFAQAMKGEELETARRMLTDMEFCLCYIQEHPDGKQADIAFRLAAIRDSLLRVQYTAFPPTLLQGERGTEADDKQQLSASRRAVGGEALIIGGLVMAFLTLAWMRHRSRQHVVRSDKPASAPMVFVEIVQEMEQLADGGGQPTAEHWESLRMLVQERHPRLIKELQQMNLSRSELQMCLLSAIDLRQKQVATLLGISPQNLRNQRLRLLARITGRQADSVADFNEWIEGMKA